MTDLENMSLNQRLNRMGYAHDATRKFKGHGLIYRISDGEPTGHMDYASALEFVKGLEAKHD
ncbi:hypothetical protein [Acetobacter okinawensis]|uniref:hypothetical protein n=1 Tax=Acetobacter okinawensis TaxID=1076594 RepID=UPI0039EB3CC8